MAKYNGIAFFDLDGVLADCGHRLHFVDEGKKRKFYSGKEIAKDYLIYPGYELVRMFEKEGRKIIFISSRRESCRRATNKWLWLVFGDMKYELYLKYRGDKREPWEVKHDLIKDAIKKNRNLYYDNFTHFYVDDYSKNCEMVYNDYGHKITPLHFYRKMDREQRSSAGLAYAREYYNEQLMV